MKWRVPVGGFRNLPPGLTDDGVPVGVLPYIPDAWPDFLRALPNFACRTPLFAVTRSRARQNLDNVVLTAQEGTFVKYSGPALDQSDLDTYLALLHFARDGHDLRKCIAIQAVEMLAALSLKDSGQARRGIIDRLKRLRRAELTVEEGRRVYFGGLLDSTEYDGTTFIVSLNWRLAWFLERDARTCQRHDIRCQLSPLGKWLYGYLSSHRDPYAVSVASIHRWCGSRAVFSRAFTQSVRQELIQLDLLTNARICFTISRKGLLVKGHDAI